MVKKEFTTVPIVIGITEYPWSWVQSNFLKKWIIHFTSLVNINDKVSAPAKSDDTMSTNHIPVNIYQFTERIITFHFVGIKAFIEKVGFFWKRHYPDPEILYK